MSDLVIYERDAHVVRLGLNRPEKLNALNPELLHAFDEAFARFERDPDARVAILYGVGRSFCVGMDLSTEAPTLGEPCSVVDDRRQLAHLVKRWLRIWDSPKPVIA